MQAVRLFQAEGTVPKAPPRTANVKALIQPDQLVGNSGAWGGGNELYDAAEYSIPFVLGMTLDKFYDYGAAEVPVLVRQGHSSTFSELRKLLSKQNFRQNFRQVFGQVLVKVGAVQYQSSRPTTVVNYIEQLSDDEEYSYEEDAPDYLFESLPVGHPLRTVVETHYPEWVVTFRP